jgi:cation:H+ antiporter
VALQASASTTSSSLALDWLVLAVGVAVALTASAALVGALERLGARFGLPEASLGLVVALAADSPEVSSAIAAYVRGQASLGTGVVLGSNAFNLAALLGLGAVVAGRIALHRKVVLLEGSVALAVALLATATVTGLAAPVTSLALTVAVLVPYVVLSALPPVRRPRMPLPRAWGRWLATAVAEEEVELQTAIAPRRGTWKDGVVVALAVPAVVGASAAMEGAASALGAGHGIPDVVTGGIVLAAVTSLPNAVAAVYLAQRNRGPAAFSVALNSNAVNVVVGLMIPAAVVAKAALSRDAVFITVVYLGLTLATLMLAWAGRGLGRWAGALIIVLYVAFVVMFAATS